MRLVKIYLFLLVQEIAPTEQKLSFSKARNNSNIRLLYNLSLNACQRECETRPSCGSINYFRAAKRCELNEMVDTSVTSSLGASRKPGGVYSDKADWADNEFKSCTCSPGQKCTNGPERCVVEECDRLKIQNMANMHTIGSKSEFSVSCFQDINGFHAFGDRHQSKTATATLTCMPDGRWKMKTPSGGQCLGVVFIMAPGTEKDPYLEWLQGSSSRSELIWDQNYRSGIIDAWDYLSINNVRLSISKSQKEVKYVVFNGTGSTRIDWLAQSRVTNSSWYDLSNARYNYFDIIGKEDDRVLRRFLMSSVFDGCPGDVGWFMVVVKSVCDWEHASDGAYPVFVYSASNEASLLNINGEKADNVYIVLNLDTY